MRFPNRIYETEINTVRLGNRTYRSVQVIMDFYGFYYNGALYQTLNRSMMENHFYLLVIF